MSEQLVNTEMQRHVGEAFAVAQRAASNMYPDADPHQWSDLQTQRAQEVMVERFQVEMLNRESFLTQQLRDETQGAAFWQKEDLNREEIDKKIISGAADLIDRVFR